MTKVIAARGEAARPQSEPFTSVELDGEGGARVRPAVAADGWRSSPAALWAIVKAPSAEVRRWLESEAGLSAAEYGALLGEPRRAWASVEGEKLLAVLPILPGDGRGGWVRILRTPNRLITISDQAMPTIDTALERLEARRGARTLSELVVAIAAAAAERVATRAFRLDADTADLEFRLESDDVPPRIEDLRALKKTAAFLRRQAIRTREALEQLDALERGRSLGLETERWRRLLRESEDVVDLVDSITDRLRTVEDYTRNRFSKILNDRMYLLTSISAIVLPLSFITGLMGVNVGGVPLRQPGWAFVALCGFLVLLAVGQFLVIRRLRWVPRTTQTAPFDPGKRDGSKALEVGTVSLSDASSASE